MLLRFMLFRSINNPNHAALGRKSILAALIAALLLTFGVPLAPAIYAQSESSVDAQRHRPAPVVTVTYTVKKGDTLSLIARRHDTTTATILRLNPQIRNPNRIYVGQRILVPAPAQQPPADPSAATVRTRIYLVALDDAGQSGQPIGCNDSLVPVTVDIPSTRAILRGSLDRLLSLRDANYGESGFYNALYQSRLTIDDVRIEQRVAIIKLSGQLVSGGTCNTPRIQAQLEQVALQFSTVDRVEITVNGIPLGDALR